MVAMLVGEVLECRRVRKLTESERTDTVKNKAQKTMTKKC